MIFGIDEVGRGCWAGPLVVAAVALNERIEGLADSKKLSPKKRTLLERNIVERYNIVIISEISAPVVDELGLSGAMTRACEELFSSISKLTYDKIIIDGNVNYLKEKRAVETVVGGDGSIPECMAASIVAKEHRDRYMRKAARKHPGYGFEAHVGYGTKQHIDALSELGPCAEHRMSFKPLLKYVNPHREEG